MTDRIEIKAQITASEAGEIEGIAWPFGTPDRVGDVIEKGAFDQPEALPMLFAHDQAQVIGIWDSITETPEGLNVKGRLLVDDVERAREVRAMIRAGAVSGLSIGFITKDATRHAKGRTIKALALHEISVVAVPCHPDARIKTGKGGTPDHEEIVLENTNPAQEVNAQTPANDAPQVDLKAFEVIKSRLDKLEAKANRPGAPAIATGKINDEKKAFVNFIRSGDASELKALAVSTPSTGGILAPDSTSAAILEKVVEMSPVRQLATVIQMSGPSLNLPRLVKSVQPQIVSETGTKPDDEPSFEEITLKPFLAGVSVPMTLSLLEDSQVNLDAYVAGHIAKQFALKESQWFVNGDGTTAPEGVMSASAGIAEMAGAVQPNDLISMFYELPQEHAANGAWLMNPKTIAAIRMLANTTGDYLWQEGLTNGQPATLLEICSKVGDA